MIRDLKRSLTMVLELLAPELRRRWLWLVPVAVIASLAEAGGAAAIFALMAALADPARIETSAVARLLRSWTEDAGATAAVLGVAVALFFSIKNAFRTYEIYLRARCAADSGTALARRLLGRFLAASYTFHLRRSSSHLIGSVEAAGDFVSQSVLGSITNIVSNTLVVLAVGAVAMVTAPWSALAAAFAVAAILLAVFRLSARTHARWGSEGLELRTRFLAALQQTLAGFKEIRVFGREAFFERDFADLRAAAAELQLKRSVAAEALPIAVETLFLFGVSLLVLVAELRGVQDVLPLVGLFAYVGFRLLPSFNQIIISLGTLPFAKAAVERIHAEYVAAAANETRVAVSGAPRLRFEQRVEVRDVSYRYPGSSRTVIENVSFEIARGEVVGMTGPSGAGKSTLVDLLLGLLEPEQGRILVDGRDIREDLRAWQRQLGYVPQSVHLFDDTVRRNVALGMADDAVDAARIVESIRQARLESVVARLPQGLETRIGERGIRLSGGERQRLAIARALYHHPAILVFDEATSSVDAATEKELAREIEALRTEKTILVVAHRAATLERCDRVLLLVEGRLTATVSPSEVAGILSRYHP
ncbi:MAG: ABC transporter ATP-binding protein, partial [Candidatus Binatia bacterium]